MNRRNLLSEDLRRAGIAITVAGVVGGFFRAHVPGAAAIYAVVLGITLCIVGYCIYQKEDPS